MSNSKKRKKHQRSEHAPQALLRIHQSENGLNSEQKRFNQLSEAIANWKLKIEDANAKMDLLRSMYAKEIRPLFREKSGLELRFAMDLEESRYKFNYAKSEDKEIEIGLRSICGNLPEDFPFSESELEFFRRWKSEEVLEIVSSEENQAEYSDFEKKSKEKPRKRKPFRVISHSARTIRSLYIQLARTFHPDGELDEDIRQEKEEKMKKIVEAYRANDFLALLAIEVECNPSKKLNSTSQSVLQQYILLMENQIEQFESAFKAHVATFQSYGLGSYINSKPDKIKRILKQQAKELQQYNFAFRNALKDLKSLGNRKNYLLFLRELD